MSIEFDTYSLPVFDVKLAFIIVIN